MKVRVYKNLHKDCYSVVSAETGRVIAHEKFVALKNITFRVRPAGRAKVLKEKRKNVHAFVCGEIATAQDFPALTKKSGFKVYYNPYKTKTFVNKKTSKAVYSADIAILNDNGILAWNIT